MTPARENPFETTRVESLIPFDPSWMGTSWEVLLERFLELENKSAIVGPHGSGKSTFLDAFESKVETATGFSICRLFLNEEKRCLTPHEKLFLTNCPNHGSIVLFLDGEEQLSFLDRLEFQRLAYGFGGVVVTRNLKSRYYSTLLETKTTPEMLLHFIHTLMPEFPGDEGFVQKLFIDSEGNIREALRKAYIIVSERSDPV